MITLAAIQIPLFEPQYYYLADMLSKLDIESKLQEVMPVLVDKFHVSKIGYFGSHANGRQTDKSDLDLLVEFSQPIGWEFFTLEKFLEQEFGLPVDLVTKNALKERIKDTILNQVIYI
jgi:predicted nucleotidyltransferase